MLIFVNSQIINEWVIYRFFNNKYQITKQLRKMFTDIELKNSFTVLTEETKITCRCGNYDRFLLRQKLQQILNTLSDEISSKQREIQKIHQTYQESIRQKEQIIERLVSANSKLTVENQILNKKCNRTSIDFKAAMSSVQLKYQNKIRELNSVVEYLEQKNQGLRRQIMSALSLIPEGLFSYKKNLNTCTIQQLRYSKFKSQAQKVLPVSPRGMQMESKKKVVQNERSTATKYNRRIATVISLNNIKQLRETISPTQSGYSELSKMNSLRSKSVSNRDTMDCCSE